MRAGPSVPSPGRRAPGSPCPRVAVSRGRAGCAVTGTERGEYPTFCVCNVRRVGAPVRPGSANCCLCPSAAATGNQLTLWVSG